MRGGRNEEGQDGAFGEEEEEAEEEEEEEEEADDADEEEEEEAEEDAEEDGLGLIVVVSASLWSFFFLPRGDAFFYSFKPTHSFVEWLIMLIGKIVN